ncbi:MAG: hypothetical protein LUE98_18520 [Tannerellaceae bacterium]|nr:hypothetical protein [Tannerellaceae bacterium]MCD8043347.1 hypothetical protein [Tannerellaceae bacterium]MCD8179285.1 hypothetical protein [Tannerellaceae bacterium]
MRGSKLDEIMTLVFLLLAVASVVVVFVANNRSMFLYVAGAAIVLRIIQYALRFFKR